MKKTQFGIMQGRIFPESYKDYNKFPKLWKKEFFATKKIGYNYLELIYDEDMSKKNPIHNLDHKIILTTIKKSKLKAYSMVLNFFAKNNLFSNINKFIDNLKILVEFAKKVNIKVIVIPIIEESSSNLKELNSLLKKLHKNFKNEKIVFSFELDSKINVKNKKKIFSKYLPRFGICYDTGNSLNDFKDFNYEINYLKNEINHLHLKDKKRVGNKFVNTYLGDGLLDFKKLRKLLEKIKYKHKVTLECFYGNNGLRSGKKNINYAFTKLL